MKKKILILYERSKKKIGGHYYRCLRLREILKQNYNVELIKVIKKKYFRLFKKF